MDAFPHDTLVEWYALDDIDGVGDDDRRIAKLCHVIESTIMNALRLSGNQNVKDHHYHTEDYFMPGGRQRMRQQQWNEMRSNLGF